MAFTISRCRMRARLGRRHRDKLALTQTADRPGPPANDHPPGFVEHRFVEAGTVLHLLPCRDGALGVRAYLVNLGLGCSGTGWAVVLPRLAGMC